jgi:mono/diheme cytochrome c family protein
MPHNLRRILAIGLLLAFAWLINGSVGAIDLSAEQGVAAHPASADLPNGPGVEIARRACLSCHEADLIVSQRLSRAGWVREVEKMVRWGAVIADTEKDPLVDYFTARFAPRRTAAVASAATPSPGAAIFEQRCLSCHEADLTRQQRLSRAGWVREVEKMVRWGAVVPEAERDPLIDYLSQSFAPGR